MVYSKKTFIKIIQLNIDRRGGGELLTAIGLAHWIMDDGFRSGNGIGL
jgi:hypothetical protein